MKIVACLFVHCLMDVAWKSLIIVIISFFIGGLPLISWITYGLTGRQLDKLGTGNISVSSAFYHTGKIIGILTVLAEALKGVGVIIIAHFFSPEQEFLQILALMSLVLGRYYLGKGAGTTNLVWGLVYHDPVGMLMVCGLGVFGFLITKDRQKPKYYGLIFMVLVLGFRHLSQPLYNLFLMALGGVMTWIYLNIPDDLQLSVNNAKSPKTMQFLKGKSSLLTLDHNLDSQQVGAKAKNLSQLKKYGYSIPDGWVLPAETDPTPLIKYLNPSSEYPLIVRSSATGEDTLTTSSAGQYLSIPNITTKAQLEQAIIDCRDSYNNPSAILYRQEKSQLEGEMSVLIQKQIKAVYSGVAFSRDPVDPLNTAVIIEALEGEAKKVVSGEFTPESYRISFIPVTHDIVIEGTGKVPHQVIREVAIIAREIERLYYGIPQDIEWIYDGKIIWIVQQRPITTLQPIWTRKIAQEVIPGCIYPLVWSINHPLTCKVWGDIFTLVLGEKAKSIDFFETATLHYSHSYFNASLLGDIFREMGLPPESLDFLLRGDAMGKPSWKGIIKNYQGLWRLIQKELSLEEDWLKESQSYFLPTLYRLEDDDLMSLSVEDLWSRFKGIREGLRTATYYSIFAPLSFAIRQNIFQVSLQQLDQSALPEIQSVRVIADFCQDLKPYLNPEIIPNLTLSDLQEFFANDPYGREKYQQFQHIMSRYGYLSQTATDISVDRWDDNPQWVLQLLLDWIKNDDHFSSPSQPPLKIWQKNVQNRLNLKGEVTVIYSQFLAHLRWTTLALARKLSEEKIISKPEEIWYLTYSELKQIIQKHQEDLIAEIPYLIQQRQWKYQGDQELKNIPFVIYGKPLETVIPTTVSVDQNNQLQGIGASSGQVEGYVKIMTEFSEGEGVDRTTILVVPYTDSGWTVFLARAGGIIAEVGGKLSHGAIIAREYGIPAVMNVHNVTKLLQNGQKVRIDGQLGLVEIL